MTGLLTEHVHPLGTLEPLRDIVGNARVVAIGESTHRVHEFYEVRHSVTRFLVEEMGFTAFVMESGFPEGWAVNDWVQGGEGDLDELLNTGITYHMGKCAEMREHVTWLRDYNATHDRKVRFYGMDIPDSAASPRPAVEAALSYLDTADPQYATAARKRLLPLYDYLPTDRTGLAWAAPALHAYMALPATHRYELTARTNELTERLQAIADPAAAVALQNAITARHTDAFLANMALGEDRTYSGANMRDAAMADNIKWILEREERIVIGAANGHIQRWPFRVPPIINDAQTMLGQHLASLGPDYVPIATTFNGGRMFLHRPIPDGAPGHTEIFYDDLAPFTEPNVLDTLMASAGHERSLLNLRTAPELTGIDAIMTGPHPQPVNPKAAFDAVIHVGTVTPWHTLIQH